MGGLLKGQCQRPRCQPHPASPNGEAGLGPSFCVQLGGALGNPTLGGEGGGAGPSPGAGCDMQCISLGPSQLRLSGSSREPGQGGWGWEESRLSGDLGEGEGTFREGKAGQVQDKLPGETSPLGVQAPGRLRLSDPPCRQSAGRLLGLTSDAHSCQLQHFFLEVWLLVVPVSWQREAWRLRSCLKHPGLHLGPSIPGCGNRGLLRDPGP